MVRLKAATFHIRYRHLVLLLKPKADTWRLFGCGDSGTVYNPCSREYITAFGGRGEKRS